MSRICFELIIRGTLAALVLKPHVEINSWRPCRTKSSSINIRHDAVIFALRIVMQTSDQKKRYGVLEKRK
jgi:hypothetical protein